MTQNLTPTADTQELVAELGHILGPDNVKFDRMTRLLYSTDASNYQIVPIGVTFPRHSEDVIAIHEIAHRYHIPIISRGGGTSLSGQILGKAIIMDFNRHMRRVRSINAEACSVTVEPGMVLGQLNNQVKALKLLYGPDPATSDRATFGGSIGNNSTGTHSILYGMAADHIRRLEVVFPDGERTWLDANTPRLNQLRAQMQQLARDHHDQIVDRYPHTWRTCAGYGLNKIDPNAAVADVNLNWLIAGSEGTLATIVQAEMGLMPAPAMRCLAIVHFDDLREALETTPRILETHPSAVEMLDRFLLNLTRNNPTYARRVTFIEGDPAVILAVEYYGDSAAELSAKVDGLRDLLHRIGYHGTIINLFTAQAQADVWMIRHAGLGIVTSERSDTKALNFIEDAAVPVDQLANYIDDVTALVRNEGATYTIYAHASAGCLHIQPLINLKTSDGLHHYRNIASGVADLVIKYHGTISGEHSEGLARGEFNEQLFGPQIMDAFRQIKHAFDPDNLLNPNRIVDVPPMDDPATMRYYPNYEVIPLTTRLDWSADHGLSGAAEMCNGSGVCRKEGTGTMCPSYMATRDEAHSTRGRANALRQAMTGHLEPENLGSQALHDVFDLCLSCKACKSECPSAVDVARMKGEFQAAYHDIHGIPLSTRLFANVHRLNALGSLIPAVSNFMLTSPVGQIGFKALGMPTERPLPKLAAQRFSRIAADVTAPSIAPIATLIIDTFTEYNQPEIGTALLNIATKLGIRIKVLRLPGQGCCGRPAISKGLLDQAKQMANANVQYLSQDTTQATNPTPFIFLEPSCMSAFTDDYPGLVDATLRLQAENIAQHCASAETWLVSHLTPKVNNLTWDQRSRDILVHGHCHQKALWGTADTLTLLRSIPGSTVTEIDSGCCGVAGSYGYEHYDLSLKIANQRLLPAIAAKPGAVVAAPGISCRTQITDAGYQAWHPVQIVAEAML